jgi:hypothetical protein
MVLWGTDVRCCVSDDLLFIRKFEYHFVNSFSIRPIHTREVPSDDIIGFRIGMTDWEKANQGFHVVWNKPASDLID